MNIAARMRELIPLLHAGINGVLLDDVKPECEDSWNEDYAIVFQVYWMTPGDLFGYDDHYFDDAQFRYDLERFMLNHFKSATTEPVVMHDRSKGWGQKYPVGTVVVNFMEGSQEIEVYRVKEKQDAPQGA